MGYGWSETNRVTVLVEAADGPLGVFVLLSLLQCRLDASDTRRKAGPLWAPGAPQPGCALCQHGERPTGLRTCAFILSRTATPFGNVPCPSSLYCPDASGLAPGWPPWV